MNKNLRIFMIADVCGEGPDYHVGDEAMAEVAISRLKEICGASNLTMASTDPQGIQRTYNVNSNTFYCLTDEQHQQLRSRPLSALKAWWNLVYQLRTHDVLFICGGGNLTSEWVHVLESRMRLMEEAFRLNKRVVLVSQTLGPYTPDHKARCSRLLEKADWVGVRDKHYSHTQTSAKVRYAVDDATFLKPQHSETTQKLVESHRPFVAFSMRKFGKANDTLLENLSSEVQKYCAANDWRTIFIPHHAPGGLGDIKIAQENQAKWPAESPLTIVEPILLADQLKALTGDAQLTISMRYHQIIFSLSMGVPVIGVYVNEYTQAKLHGAFEQFGLAPKLISIDEVGENLSELAAYALQERSLFEAAAHNAATQALEQNMKPYELVDSWQKS